MCATAACSYFHLEDAYQKVLQQIEENAEFQTRLNETDKWMNEWAQKIHYNRAREELKR